MVELKIDLIIIMLLCFINRYSMTEKWVTSGLGFDNIGDDSGSFDKLTTTGDLTNNLRYIIKDEAYIALKIMFPDEED